MSYVASKPGLSTGTEAQALTNLTNLSTTPGGYYIVKTGTITFENVLNTALTNPMTTSGDIIYGGSSGTPTRLAKGSDGQVLVLASGIPSWSSASTGTVTTVSVATANGFSGTVANATTTPAITIIAGAITPTSVNGLTISTSTGTLTITDGKTISFSNTLTFSGTDSTTMTFPSTSATIARTDAANTFTGHQTIEGVTSTGATGTGKFVFDGSPTLTTASLGSSTATTQSSGDNSTKVATTAFVQAAITALNPAVAVQVATTAAGDTSGFTYNNGTSGVGATLTQNSAAIYIVDGYTFTTIGQRLLVKNDTQSPSGAYNGVYSCTTVGTSLVPAVFTRALDYNTTADINNTGAIPVVNGTANALTSWLLTSTVGTIGTDALTYSKFSYSPTTIITPALGGTGVANNSANTITFSGNYGLTLTLSNTTSVTLPTSGTLVNSSVATLSSLTSIGTIGTGTWQGTVVGATYGGTGVNNGSNTLTLSGGSFTVATNGGTLAFSASSKTLTVSNSITLAGTDSTTMTFPATSDTVAVLGTAQTYTATMTEKQVVWTNNAITASGNAATVPITSRLNTVTNNSAATLTITMTTTSAVDGQLSFVRILDATGVAQTITWVNTENSTVTVPTTSNGSTTLFLSVGFIYNGSTSKWRCIASA